MTDPRERLMGHADWLEQYEDAPQAHVPGEKLGEIARDIREYIEDAEDAEKIGGTCLVEMEVGEWQGFRFICVEDSGADTVVGYPPDPEYIGDDGSECG